MGKLSKDMINLKAICIKQCRRCYEIKKVEEFGKVVVDEYFTRDVEKLFYFHHGDEKPKTKKELLREYKDRRLYRIEQETMELCLDCIESLK